MNIAAAGALAGGLFAAAALASDAGTLGSYRHLVLDGHALKWGAPAFGAGARVTYALVERRLRFDGARNCSSMKPLDGLLARNGIAPGRFSEELVAALGVWEGAADISFAPADPVAADILIGAQVDPVGFAFANVTYDTTAPVAGPRSISRSLVCFNPQRPWKVGFDGDLDVYDLRYTLIHEIGHAIGLDHPAIDGQLMAHKYSETFRVLQAGDVRGVEALYGPRRTALGADLENAIARKEIAAE